MMEMDRILHLQTELTQAAYTAMRELEHVVLADDPELLAMREDWRKRGGNDE